MKWFVAIAGWAFFVAEALLLRKWFGFEVAVLVTIVSMWNAMPKKSDIAEAIEEALRSRKRRRHG